MYLPSVIRNIEVKFIIYVLQISNRQQIHRDISISRLQYLIKVSNMVICLI